MATDEERGITVELEAYFDLREDEIWPDGAPQNWTIDDVRRVMEKTGSIDRLIREWNLGDAITVTIHDDGDGDTTNVWETGS